VLEKNIFMFSSSIFSISVVTSVFRYFSKNRYLHISFEISTVIQHILYFLDSAHLADHFYIGFDG